MLNEYSPPQAVVYMLPVLKVNYLNNKIFAITNCRLCHFYFFYFLHNYLVFFYLVINYFDDADFLCYTLFLLWEKIVLLPLLFVYLRLFFTTVYFLGVFNVNFFINYISIFLTIFHVYLRLLLCVTKWNLLS